MPGLRRERFDVRDLGQVLTHIHDQEIEIAESASVMAVKNVRSLRIVGPRHPARKDPTRLRVIGRSPDAMD